MHLALLSFRQPTTAAVFLAADSIAGCDQLNPTVSPLLNVVNIPSEKLMEV